MPKGDATLSKITDSTKAEIITSTLTDIEVFRNLPPVEKADTETCKQRVQMFFDFCRENAKIPTVELLCVAIGRSRQTLVTWQNDEKCENGRIISNAKACINACLTDLTVNGSINAIYTMFQQKTNYGYIEPKNPLEMEITQHQDNVTMSIEERQKELSGLLGDDLSILLDESEE